MEICIQSDRGIYSCVDWSRSIFLWQYRVLVCKHTHTHVLNHTHKRTHTHVKSHTCVCNVAWLHYSGGMCVCGCTSRNHRQTHPYVHKPTHKCTSARDSSIKRVCLCVLSRGCLCVCSLSGSVYVCVCEFTTKMLCVCAFSNKRFCVLTVQRVQKVRYWVVRFRLPSLLTRISESSSSSHFSKIKLW